MTLSQIDPKIVDKVRQMDDKLNALRTYDANDIQRYLYHLITFNRVEVGWRESCGKTDHTHKVYREWVKVVKMLAKSGVTLTEEPVTFGNSYATLSGGFWRSIIYTIN
jgi:hypothetical protein